MSPIPNFNFPLTDCLNSADVVAAFATIFAGYMSDRFQKRGVFIIGFSSVGILGFILNMATRNPHIRYAGKIRSLSGADDTEC